MKGTQLMAIYQPYFYVIQDNRNCIYYAGAKWVNADPTNFMKLGGYITSSDIIKTIIDIHGISAFVVRKIRTFETADQAQNYETRFLRRVNAKVNPKFYNGHNNDGAMNVAKMKMVMMELYGVENAMQSQIVKNRLKNTMLVRYDVDHYSKTEEYKEKYSSTSLLRYGFDNPNKHPAIKQKIIDTNMKTFGVPYYTQSERFRDSATNTWLEKYGVDNPSKSESIKNKIGEKAKERDRKKRQRFQVVTIQKYIDKFGSKSVGCGNAWFRKSDDFLDSLLSQTIERFGPI